MKSFHAGDYVSQGWYNSYQPNPINRNWVIDDMEIVNLLSKADRVVGRLDMFSEYESQGGQVSGMRKLIPQNFQFH